VLSVADSSGRSPLHLAVAGRSSGAVEWLLQRDSELQRDSDVVNAGDNYGRCPLHYVSTVEVAAKLFAGGAKLDARDQNGLSPLHYICARDSKDVLNWFIEQGVTLKSGDLLHSAVLGGSISIILAKLTAHGWLEEQIYGSQEFTESLTKSTRSVYRVTVRVKPYLFGGPGFKFKGAILPEWICSSFRKALLPGVLSLNFPYYPLSRPPSLPGLLH
jgi:hypothetical protein